jgi:hypothetical protein
MLECNAIDVKEYICPALFYIRLDTVLWYLPDFTPKQRPKAEILECGRTPFEASLRGREASTGRAPLKKRRGGASGLVAGGLRRSAGLP